MRVMIALLLLAAFLPAAGAQGDAGSVSLTIEARDTQCPEGKTFCFVVTSGSLSDLAPGANVSIHFINAGANVHELLVTTTDDADPEHRNTSPGPSMARSEEDMPPGAEDNFTFTVPADASGLYFWCHVSGHEQLGMWIEQRFATEPTPSAAWVALVALATVAFVAFRRP